MSKLRAAWGLVLVASLACGGGESPMLVFRVFDASGTGIRVPTELDAFSLSVYSVESDASLERFARRYPLARTDGRSVEGAVRLPQTLAVVPVDRERPGTVMVVLRGFRGDEERARFVRVAAFGVGRVDYDLPLDPRCFDVRCADDQRCEDGACRSVGVEGTDGGVVDASTDAGFSCAPSFTDCGGECVDLANDVAHCGACGRACAPGVACVSGSCGCPSGLVSCGGRCVDVRSSPDHCGACDRRCVVAHGDASCVGGVCQLFTCEAGWEVFEDGTCVEAEVIRACAPGERFFYVDADRDGWGRDGEYCGGATPTCSATRPSRDCAPVPGDCDDMEAGIHPGRTFGATPVRGTFDVDCVPGIEIERPDALLCAAPTRVPSFECASVCATETESVERCDSRSDVTAGCGEAIAEEWLGLCVVSGSECVPAVVLRGAQRCR